MSAKPAVGEAIAEIKKGLGSGGWIDNPADMQPYLTSWRNGWTGKSPLVALPSNTAQVAEIVAICHRHHVSIVPQGGNTGLVGGSVPSQSGNEIVISLSRLNKIRDIDPIASTVTVDAGTVLQRVQETAAEAGFLFPLTMGSEGSAQVGGAISTNAGGTAVLRYGNMRDLVMGLEAVLPDGQIFSSLHKLPKDNTGYNLGSYFIGAEGTLGIVTAATLKLFPRPQQTLTAVIALGSADVALELLKTFRKECAEWLSAFEIMSHQALKLVTKHISGTRFPGKDNAPYYLLVELGASSQGVPLRSVFENLASEALESGKILDAVIAENTAQAKQFWQLRDSISESARKEGPGIHFDISLPLAQIPNFLRQMEPQIKAVTPDMILFPFGHIGDGNLHYNMYFSPAQASDKIAALKKRIQDIVYAAVKSMRGSISAEHGIGIERKAELASYKTSAEIDVMRKIKRALDPDGLMNPGKIFNI